MSLTPGSANVRLGDQFSIDVKIDSVKQTLNAAQATIIFPKDRLEVISVSREGSIFDFWLEEPTFSNTEGKIRFIGGIQNGVSGGSLKIIKVTFKPKSVGNAAVNFDDAAITASDGSGTNLLTSISGGTFTISTTQTVSPPATTTSPSPQQPTLTPPPPVTRPPTIGKSLPAKPKLKIELYPDPEKWYDVSSMFLARWELPNDIAGISTLLNHNTNSIPPATSEGLTEGKLIDRLKDGIWYFHVRFRNNIGWGETTHYRIAVDTEPPSPFTIDIPTGRTSDDPRPTLRFAASDGLSGIDRYSIRINGGEAIDTKQPEFTLPPQPPGEHRISVRAFDRAGNSRETTADIAVSPIPTPTITFITSFITANTGETFFVKGRGTKDDVIHVEIYDKKDQLIADGKTPVNQAGEWGFDLQKDLRIGEYYAKIFAEDSRGALSFPVQAGAIIVKAKPALKIGLIELSASQLLIILIAIVIAGGSAIWYSLKIKADMRLIRYGLVEYDLHKMINLLENNTSELEKRVAQITDTESLKNELKYWIKSFTDTIQKIKNYLPKEVEKLKK